MRLLILDRTTVAVLQAHRARQNAACAATGSEPSSYVFTDLFTDLRGQPLHPEYLYSTLKKLIKQADLPRSGSMISATPQPASRWRPVRTSRSSPTNSATPPSS